MLKLTFNWFLHIGGILTLIMFMSGCSLFKGPLYPDVIYNNRHPLISVSYEYGEIEIKLPLNYIGVVPDIISFEVYAHGDTTNPIISILQEAPRVFFVYLPQGVLDIHNKLFYNMYNLPHSFLFSSADDNSNISDFNYAFRRQIK